MELDVNKIYQEESNLGSLDDFIISKNQNPNTKNGTYYDKVVIRTTKRPLELSLYKIYREYPLVCDNVKKIFNIYRTRYYHAQIEGVKYLVRICINEIPLDDYIKLFSPLEISNKNKITNIGLRSSFINEVQRIIAFNWVMCIATINNTEGKIYVRCLDPTVKITTENFRDVVVYPFTCNERDYSKDVANCDITDRTLNKWFRNNRELFYEHIKKLTKGIDIEYFKIDFEKIIRSTNTLLIPWVNIVYNRMLSIQFLNIEEDIESDEEV